MATPPKPMTMKPEATKEVIMPGIPPKPDMAEEKKTSGLADHTMQEQEVGKKMLGAFDERLKAEQEAGRKLIERFTPGG